MTRRTMKTVFGFEPDLDAEMELLRASLDNAGDVIFERLVQTDVACRLYDAHVTAEDDHSCLGCNLNEAIHELGHFLLADIEPASQLTRLHCALNLVNTVWERIRDVCRTLELPKSLWDENELKFSSFKTARWWTNFMKHPGFFGLGIHHPILVMDGGPSAAEAIRADDRRSRSQEKEWVLIDTQFVKEHWADDHAGSKLRQQLDRPFTACVVLPDLGALAPALCDEFIDFVQRMEEPTWVELARKHALAEMPCDWWDTDSDACSGSE